MRGRYIDVEGVNTYYLDEGAGPVIVLLHGAAVAVDARLAWFRTIEALRDAFRLIAPDQPGFGRTDMPADGGYRDRHQRTEHALAFLERLGVRDACLVGHSEGGYMATRLGIVAPHLASRLVIVTSGGTAPALGGADDDAWIAASEAAYDDPSRLEGEDAFVRASRGPGGIADARYERILRENFRRAIDTGQVDRFRGRPSRDTDYRAYVQLQEEHLFPHLGSLAIPVLLIWAAQDATVPVARGLKLLERIPGAELHLFRDAAHNVMHECAPGFNRLMRGWCAPRRGAPRE